MAARRLSCGLDYCTVPDVNNSLSAATAAGYEFVCCPIVHPRYKREFMYGKAKDRQEAFTRSDMHLASQDWSSLVVGKLSPYLKLDSPNDSVRRNSEQALSQELLYASHLGLTTVLVTLRSSKCVNLARHIHNRILANVSYQIWVHVPMQASHDITRLWLGGAGDCLINDFDAVFNVQEDTWEWWNTFRNVCNSEKKVSLSLEVTADIPSEDMIQRWLGEPVRCIILPTHIFLTNKKGFPVLSRAHQHLIRRFYKLDVQIIVSGANRHNHIKLYQQYMEYLWQSQPPDDSVSSFARGFEDYLQCPLQPLMDNLESQTYEIFEKDPVKYSEYQKAIYQALLDRINENEKHSVEIIVMVVGAGRGPLVRATLSAAQKADRKVKVYAVEKNPNAIVTLFSQQDEMWGDAVTVVASDMREWDPPEKADILISELLGSFGDNELSPECLDGAQKFMKDDAISIPCSYSSYLSPIQSSKLYNEVRQLRERDKSHLVPFETPYVVQIHNRLELAPPQPLFTFHHPNKDPVIDNTRYKILKFNINQKALLHGFAGYFEAVLYKNVNLSILPETHSPGMFSWFPILFPIKDPVALTKGCEVEVHFWRCANKRSVWYEWLVTKPQFLPIHNPNGRSYTIGL